MAVQPPISAMAPFFLANNIADYHKEQTLVSTEMSMEKSMQGISLDEHIRVVVIRDQNWMKDVIVQYSKLQRFVQLPDDIRK